MDLLVLKVEDQVSINTIGSTAGDMKPRYMYLRDPSHHSASYIVGWVYWARSLCETGSSRRKWPAGAEVFKRDRDVVRDGGGDDGNGYNEGDSVPSAADVGKTEDLL